MIALVNWHYWLITSNFPHFITLHIQVLLQAAVLLILISILFTSFSHRKKIPILIALKYVNYELSIEFCVRFVLSIFIDYYHRRCASEIIFRGNHFNEIKKSEAIK